MPIYEWRCVHCGEETEEISTTLAVATPRHCGTPMSKKISASSFTFKTRGGNNIGFSGAHGPVTKGSRKNKVIGWGHGLGGNRGRKPPTMSEVMSDQTLPGSKK